MNDTSKIYVAIRCTNDTQSEKQICKYVYYTCNKVVKEIYTLRFVRDAQSTPNDFIKRVCCMQSSRIFPRTI